MGELGDRVDNAMDWLAGKAKQTFEIELDEESLQRMALFARELLKWNRVFNLTSIREVEGVAELHLLDSLALLPHLPSGVSVLDVGSGGGFPGLPIAIARGDLQMVLVDRTEKKVSFLKTVIARLGISSRVVALHRRLEGDPSGETMDRFAVVVSRAFAAPAEWFALARAYLAEGGVAVAMLGSERPVLADLAEALGCSEERFRLVEYRLPSGAERALLFWRPQFRWARFHVERSGG